MHTDEAVHAIKFGALLENNHYRYDPNEYHGPTLNYFTLIPAWLGSAQNITDINENTLRIIPVCFGMLLILILLILRDGLGRSSVLWTGLFTAISPAMVYYSRYYIQEMLLVCLTFAALASAYRYTQKKQFSWAVATGISLGLMHATKETSVIAFGAMGIALVFILLAQTRKSENRVKQHRIVLLRHIWVALITAMLISFIFYSSFFTNWRGIFDSLLTYQAYLHRAGHKTWHIHPWYYYFKLLVGSKQPGTPYWSEIFIIIMAGFGLLSIIRMKQEKDPHYYLTRFLGIYTLTMTLIYILIPYKTPWSMLGFYHGFIVLAGMGAGFLFSSKPKKWIRLLVMIYIAGNSIHLTVQSYLSNYRFETDPSNPYVYAHTGKDIFQITHDIEQISRIHPDGKKMFIEVIYPGADYWPLPWYLRSYTNVGWWQEVDFTLPPALLILASPGVEADLLKKLYDLPPPGQRNLYLPLFESYTELRPHVELRGYVVKALWDKTQQSSE